MNVLQDCAAYFREDAGFARLMSGLLDMYVRYERCFGAVRLSQPAPEEEKALSAFFKRDYYNQALIRISLADFERQVQRMFSEKIQLEALLEAYTRRPVIRRTGGKTTANAFSTHVESELMPRYIGTDAEFWLREIVAHTRRTYRKWADRYIREPREVTALVDTLCGFLNDLPCLSDTTETLADFVERHGCDARDFEINGAHGPLLLRALARRFDVSLPGVPEECGALYYRAGLLTEGVLNRVTVRGVQAWWGDARDAVCEAYNALGEPHVLTLRQIDRFTRAEAFGGKVYVMENLPEYAAVTDHLPSGNPCAVICVENALNVAALRLLTLLTQGGAVIHYSGDMDYKGLALADKLYRCYPKHFVPWRYNKEDYERVASDHDFYFPEIKRGQGLHSEDLAALLSQIRKKGKTAAQRALVKDLTADIIAAGV